MQIHGGDIYNNEVELDFSANINPLGMPEAIQKAAVEGMKQSIHYPDSECNQLREAIARKEGVTKDMVICGNGAADLIFQVVLAKRPKKALLLAPTFLEYEQALHTVDCEIVFHELKEAEEFQVTNDYLEVLDFSFDLAFLCNPNNPTGQVVDSKLLDQIIKRCKECGITLVMDECFQDFLSPKDQNSKVASLAKMPHVFVLKAFTKMYGMAGLRLGYGLCKDQQLLCKMRSMSQPWNVSTPAQYAGIAACKEDAFAIESQAYLKEQRDFLVKELERLGFHVYGSKANFIFFFGEKGLYEACLAKKVLIRSCANYHGLGEQYYRIAVKSKEENMRFLKILEKICKE